MARTRGPRIRSQRVSEEIRMVVAEILQRDLKDPRLGMVTCTRVELTRDLRHAKVYVGVLGDEDVRKRSMAALSQATGYVRRLVSSRLALRLSPELVFLFDPSVEYQIRLESLIDETKSRTPADEATDDGEAEAGDPATE